ncbi:MAG: signal transduction histidine kinase [Granulosicoccus sp.]|jgi:signal transduction histidine kinase
MAKQRSLKNIFVRPKFQLKLCLFYAVTGVTTLGAVTLFILNQMRQVQSLMNQNARIDMFIQNQINDLMLSCIQYSLFGFMFYVVIAFTFALVMGHRIAGPQVAIKDYINSLQERDYDNDRNLRTNDELADILQALKELKTTLIHEKSKVNQRD